MHFCRGKVCACVHVCVMQVFLPAAPDKASSVSCGEQLRRNDCNAPEVLRRHKILTSQMDRFLRQEEIFGCEKLFLGRIQMDNQNYYTYQ